MVSQLSLCDVVTTAPLWKFFNSVHLLVLKLDLESKLNVIRSDVSQWHRLLHVPGVISKINSTSDPGIFVGHE